MKKSIVLIPLPSLIKNSFVRSFVQFFYLQAGLYGKDFMASIKKADDSHSLAVRVVDWPECCLDLSTVTGAYSLQAPA